jgi:hypothetical protein
MLLARTSTMHVPILDNLLWDATQLMYLLQ